ncbi:MULTISPECIES: DMT family transporter [unclassified Arcicella]|uniref:DMT family transporter n=1 Tax=unclassified Arcicella TaxID=2644986 RepID=UPI0028561BEA|nr:MULTISPECIES: DMT family transporter [unclassified Arcicella]MDR6560063.1 drug/metabolite transporter (DMT)-like permease [Arcicella sp. BE51]MDR6810330.1 drug/metabolite transporter (DMT)-like permease [Arcicella sp. BE140]MDR6821680.1 drug/metabolite transporter (DMT)-like permease [Arcicella sp. BE139]
MKTTLTTSTTVPTKLQNPLLVWGLLALLAGIWGSSFILVKKSLTVFDPAQVGSIRIFSAFCFFLPFFIINIKKIPLNKAVYFLLAGLLGNLLPAYLFSFAGSKLDSGVSGALNSTTPLFTLIVGALFFSNKITQRQGIGIVLGFVGALLLILAGATGFHVNGYAFFVIAATLLYGINLNITKKYLTGLGIDSFLITSSIFMTIGPVAAGVLFSTDFVSRLQQPNALQALIFAMLLGVLGSAIAMVLFNRLIQMTSAVLASSVTYLIPIVAILWGVLDGEAIIFQHYLGMSIILIGVYLVNKSN